MTILSTRWAAATLALSLLWPSLVLAQASLEIRVLNTDGSPASGASVTLRNTGQGTTQTKDTDAQGRTRFGALPATSGWQLSASTAQGRAQTRDLELRTDFARAVTLILANQSVETIDVRGGASITKLNTSNAEVSATLSAEQIALIPIEARSLERLLFRLPGVTQSTGFFGEAPSVAINGANALFTNYMVDGLDNNENFLGGQRFPLPIGAVQDVTVLVSSYSVEFGRTANGVVNVTTPSGDNEFGGEVAFVARPGGFLTKTPDGTQTSLFGAPVSDSFERYQGAITLHGPIQSDKTFFFLNAEYIRDETDNLLSVPELGIAGVLPGTNEQVLLTGKIDHFWSPQWRSALRINHGRVTLERQGGGLAGGNTFPSAGSVQDRVSTNIALTTTYSGDDFDYSGALQYSRFSWDFGQPIGAAGPQVTLFAAGNTSRSIGTIGHPGFIFDETENTWQTKHIGTWTKGRHRVKAGFDVIFADYSLFGGGNVNGNFQVALSPDQLTGLSAAGTQLGVSDLPADVDIVSAVFETQPNAFGRTQRLFGIFVEDQVQVSDTLSLTFGLRWDYDSLTGIAAKADLDNIAPRFAFNYSPTDTLSIRGGVGRFVEKLPYAVVSDAIQQNSTSAAFLGQLQGLIDQGILPTGTDLNAITTNEGNRTFDAAGLCTGLSGCPDPQSLRADADALPIAERRVFNPNGLDNPEAIQASLGVEWQARPDLVIGLDLQYARGRNLLRLIDLNAAAPFDFNQAEFARLGVAGVAALSLQEREALGLIRSAATADATRPTAGAARSVILSDSGGRSRYKALIFKVQKARGSDFYDASFFYTLSRLENDTDDINFRADDSNRFDRDFGPSLNDRTHVLSALVTLYPLDGLTLSFAGLLQSGQPVNFVPDPAIFGVTDINGDGLSTADQFTGNPDRFPGTGRNSGRLPWSHVFDVGAGYALDTPVGTFDLRADIFNVFNANNQSGFPVNFTASNQIQTFGQAFLQRSAGPARTFQLSGRYRF